MDINILDPNLDFGSFIWDCSEGIPSEFSIKQHITDPTDADLLYAPEDYSEGSPSEFSTGHTSNASAEPSLHADSLHVAIDDLERNPSESSIGHDSKTPTDPSYDEDRDAASTRSSSSLRIDRPSQTTPQFCMNRSHNRSHWLAVRSSFAAYAAANRTSTHQAGIPAGSVNSSRPLSNEHEGIPSCSEPRPSAPTSRPAKTDPASDYEQQLARLLTLLAERKRDVVIHIPAGPSLTQYQLIRTQFCDTSGAHNEVCKLVKDALAAREAWLTHIDALEARDSVAGAVARRTYDRFSTEYGLAANLDRAKQLEAMLCEAREEAEKHWQRLRALPEVRNNWWRRKALPEDQKMEAFSIVGKMPPNKLYERPGIPGHSALKGGRPDEQHGIPCAPMSKPTPSAATRRCLTSTRRHGRQEPAATESAQSDSSTGPAPSRRYCVFCGRHDHWSSDCTAHDLRARWQLINQRKQCRQCLRAGHHTADCVHADRRCKHCVAHHHAALCPKPHQRFLPSSDVSASPVPGHPSVAVAAGGRSPPGSNATAPSEEAHRFHDDRHTTTNPLDTKPPSSCSLPPHAAADVEAPEHRLAKAITSFFQRNSAGSDVVVGFYARSQDDSGRTFYRILKPMVQPSQTPRHVDDVYAHLEVDRVFMVETTAHLLPRDSLLPSSATPDADSRHSTRWSTPKPSGSSFRVAATDLSGVTPRRTTVASDLATAMRTPLLPRADALSPTTTDSATTEVEPEDHGAVSRRSRRKRGQRRTQCSKTRSTSSTTSTPSTPCKTQHALGAPLHDKKPISADQIPTAAARVASAGSPAEQGIPFATSLASNRNQTRPRLSPSSATSDAEATIAPAQHSFAAGGPSTTKEQSMGKQRRTTPVHTLPTSERQLPLKRVRTWTASSRKQQLPKFSSSTTSLLTPSRTGHTDRLDSGATASSSRNAAKRKTMIADHSATLVIARKYMLGDAGERPQAHMPGNAGERLEAHMLGNAGELPQVHSTPPVIDDATHT